MVFHKASAVLIVAIPFKFLILSIGSELTSLLSHLFQAKTSGLVLSYYLSSPRARTHTFPALYMSVFYGTKSEGS